MGEPQDAVAGEQETGVAVPVSLEGGAGPVESVAVELDDQTLARPKRVDLEARDKSVDPGPRQAMIVAEVKEDPLELRAGGGNRTGLVGEEPKQGAEASSAASSQADVLDRIEVQQISAVGLLEGTGELALRDHPGKVEERPRDRCDRDAHALRTITVA